MRRTTGPAVASATIMLVSIVLGSAAEADAQTAAAPPQTGPAPSGLVVGSGNYFSPIVPDLDKAVAFYRDGLGLDLQGAPGDAANNPALRDMFGLPDAKLRWQIARTPAVAGGVEIIEIASANGKPVERRMQDPGAITLLATVRDLDATFARLKQLGAPVVSRGGAPARVGEGAQKARIVVVKDPAGHFLELVQYDQPQPSQAPATANVTDVRVRLTVDNVDQAVRLYRDALGLKLLNEPQFREDTAGSAALGVDGGQYRVAFLQVPTSGLMLDLVDFKGVDRRTVAAGIQDFGSTRMQMRVRDVDATIAAFAKFGGTVASTGGKPLDLPAGNNKLKVAIVRDPNNLFVVLIESPPPAR